jgi:formylmethanofuran dehydrogenase subunit E
METIDILLQKAKDFHGEICPGIVMGTRMTIAALRELGRNPLKRNYDLIVYVEIDRCATDAIQAITGVSLGHRSLKHMNYGKFAATFIDAISNKAVRITAMPKKADQPRDMNEVAKMVCNAPEEELFQIQKVIVNIPSEDMPGFPTRKDTCSMCGEQVMDRKEVIVDGKAMCKNCAEGSYYTLITTPDPSG